MIKKVERTEIDGIPVRISVVGMEDPCSDTCWVTFELINAEFNGTFAEFIIALGQRAKSIAEKRGFAYLTSAGWDRHDVFVYRCGFSKVNWEEYYND